MMAVFLIGVVLIPISAQATGLSITATPALQATATPQPVVSPVPAAPPPDISWLDGATAPADLASDQSLAILAGKLIFHGLVEAGSCPDAGLLPNGYASPCGERVARNAVVLWQNQFDEAILDAAGQYQIPPYVLKNVISRESQFWPARHLTIYGYYEYGLGHITQMGADTLLRWNQDFYKSFCRQVYSDETCKTSYGWLPANQQAVLRGAALQVLAADCESCTAGIDLQRARASVPVIAAAIKANYNHLDWLLRGFTSSTPNRAFETNDLWRLTISSYNAGPGCITTAATSAAFQHLKLNWKNISGQFDKGCEGALAYVDSVSAFYPASSRALGSARLDDSKAARMVFAGLGIDFPTPTVEASTVTSETASPTLETATASLEPGTTTPTQAGPTATLETVIASPTIEAPTFTPEPGTVTTTLEVPTATPEPGSATPSPDGPTATLEPGTATLTLEGPTATIETVIASPTPDVSGTPMATATSELDPTLTASTAEVVVKFRALVPQLIADAVIQSAGGEVGEQIDALDLTVVDAPAEKVQAVLDALQNNLLVSYAEPNYSGSVMYTPNDPGFAGQGSLLDLHVPQAWDITRGEGVIVAVIDTGVDVTHPDLNSNIWINPGETGPDAAGNDKRTNGIDDDQDGYVDDWQGWNFANNSNNISDLNGHGTHSAGIIAARMDNNEGIAGVAPLSQVMVLKGMDDTGYGSYADVAKAITYAVDHGARVINLGFGGTDKSTVLQAATDYAYSHAVTVVAAAGNAGANAVYYPAANPDVIAVSALDASLNLATFSSYGDAINLAAPGVGIYSTAPGGNYVQLSGTSMSAAQVSGIAALLASQSRFDTPNAIRAALFGTAADLGDPGVDIYTGHGLAQAFEALGYTGTDPTPTSAVTSTPEATSTPGGGGMVQVDASGALITDYAVSCSTTTYSTQLAGTTVGALAADEAGSGALNIGFDFWYMGTRYTQLYASSNGWLSFNNPGTNYYPTNDLDNNGNTNAAVRPFIAPLWDNLSGSGGTAAYATTGTAPNRTFTFEWWNWRWSSTAANPVLSFKVILYESTGAIQFVYHQNGTAVNAGSASIGITGSTNASFLSAQSIAACPTFSSTVETANLATKPPEGTVWTFTPARPPAPAGLNLTNLSTSATTATLNWTDNSNNELVFAIYSSTDGTTWAYRGAASANATSFNATGLTAGTNYYWRVFAVSEGGMSLMAGVNPPANMTFTNVGLSSMNVNWTDNSTNETGFLVYRSTDGVNYTLMTTVGPNVTTYNALGLATNTTYYWRVMAIGASTITTPVSGSQATPFVSTQPPTVAILAPASGSSFVAGRTITFRGSGTIPTNGDISQKLVWYLDGTTSIGPGGSSFTLDNLAVGSHSITASVTDDYGRTASASITVTITANPSPHTGFNGSTEQCAICHRSHSAQQQSPYQIGSTLSPNDLCLSCHSSSAKVVSTHSNVDWVAAGYPNPRSESAFELQCIQCHNPHGLDTKSNNLNNIRASIWLNNAATAPTDPEGLDLHLTTGPVVFTAKSGPNSFDDGTAGTANKLCATCHANAANQGFPITLHTGGAGHGNGTINYTALNCTQCHPHSLDSSPSTRDGFQTTCRACHSQQLTRTSSPGTRRQIVSNPITSVNGGDFKRTSHHINDALSDADCLKCHEMSLHKQGRVRLKNADSPATVYQLDYTFTPGAPTQADADSYEAFCASCHDSNGAAGNLTPFSDGKIAPSVTGLWASARHNLTVGTFLGSCMNCHDNGHGSNKLKLLAPWNFIASTSPDAMQQEEKFCFNCHTTTPGRSVSAAFSTWTNTATRFFAHDVSVDKGLDHGKEVFGSAFGGTNRHIECGDCHESHKDAYPNTATAPAIKLSQRGASGVEPTYSGSGAPGTYSFLGQAANEYQVCFKCHSSYTTLPSYTPDGWGCTANPCTRNFVVDGLRKLTRTANGQVQDTRDLAKAFNPNNASFHPLLAVGKNTAMFAGSFMPGWGVNSRVYCSDCHTNATPATGGTGPHGSPMLHVLDGSTTGDTNYSTQSFGTNTRNVEPTVPNTEICFKCHQYSVYVSGSSSTNTYFRNGSQNLHYEHMLNGRFTATTCYTCHNTHGGNNLSLVNFEASVAVPLGGRTSETAWARTATQGTCYVSCHSMNHNPVNYTP
ncbi:MAG TPA: S8 family serine peptidase [Anaerolineales bacterium]